MRRDIDALAGVFSILRRRDPLTGATLYRVDRGALIAELTGRVADGGPSELHGSQSAALAPFVQAGVEGEGSREGGGLVSADVLDKVRKLLRLAESPNANEAAAAAAKAQQLIDEHNLSAALLSIETGVDAPDEPIEDFAKKGAHLDAPARLDRWRIELASSIAYANSCRIYYTDRLSARHKIALVGRPSDADTVRYLYAHLCAEVNQLADRDGKGYGRTWRNNFRLGVVDTIRGKLRQQQSEFKQQATASLGGNSQALVRVNTALAKVEQRGTDVRDWMKRELKLYAGRAASSTYDHSARRAGQLAGESIRLRRDGGRRLEGAGVPA